MDRCVLDTNVLVAGLRSRRGASFRLLELVAQGRLQPVLSVPLVLEYEAVLRRNGGPLHLGPSDVGAFLDYLCRVGEVHHIHFLWRPTLRDPRDEMVLEVAVSAGLDTIVTHNVADFRGGEAFGVRAITPRQFLFEMRGAR